MDKTETALINLIHNREQLIKVHQENNFTDGIHALLTDLYPDTAHFIYELLQNAEDMDATLVRFELYQDHLLFEHNGTKRDFTVEDIDAITNIGSNSLKKDDPTAIGKFGVGFKAVFAYTQKPEIHSGSYHFRIENYFVPVFENVPEISVTDERGCHWTRFVFPFDHPSKSAYKARTEIKSGLLALDETALLFLNSIQRIEYIFPGNKSGFIERSEKRIRNLRRQRYVEIHVSRPAAAVLLTSHWLVIQGGQGVKIGRRKWYTSIAFRLRVDSKNRPQTIIPIEGGGKTFVYFPAEKEYSGLFFHINAPFSTTVARDSIVDCEENKALMENMKLTISESFGILKEQNLYNMSFLEVLPNDHDNLTLFYSGLRKSIVLDFYQQELVQTKNGRLVKAGDAISGPADLNDLLDDEFISTLIGRKLYWMSNSLRNSRSDLFLQSLATEKYTYRDFLQSFHSEIKTDYIEEQAAIRDDTWLRKFYYVLMDAYYGSAVAIQRLNGFKNCKFIRCSGNVMVSPATPEVYYCPEGVVPVSSNTLVIKPAYFKNRGSRTGDQLRKFFNEIVKIPPYSIAVEVERLLNYYAAMSSITPDKNYYQALLVFADFHKTSPVLDEKFRITSLFISAGTGKRSLFKGEQLAFGNQYQKSGDYIANIYSRGLLAGEYKRIYKGDKLQSFIQFAKDCGVMQKPYVYRQPASCHPEFTEVLFTAGNFNKNGVNKDWTIASLDELLQKKTIRISQIIWDIILNDANASEHIRAEYTPNKKQETRVCDSTLVYLLKKYAWIPNTRGRLYRPEDIRVSDIRQDFEYDPENAILNALQFGHRYEEDKLKREKLEADAASEGMHLLSDIEYKEYSKWKRLQQKKAAEIKNKSAKELLVGENKIPHISEAEDTDVYLTEDGAVRNAERRVRKLQETFTDLENMPSVERRLYSTVSVSNEQEKTILKEWYGGSCQICGTRILDYKGRPYFVARNIIRPSKLPIEIRNTLQIGWNSLCLCPNCAARYEVCAKDISGIYEQIQSVKVSDGDKESIKLQIQLEEKSTQIEYVPKHFIALQTVLREIDKLVR